MPRIRIYIDEPTSAMTTHTSKTLLIEQPFAPLLGLVLLGMIAIVLGGKSAGSSPVRHVAILCKIVAVLTYTLFWAHVHTYYFETVEPLRQSFWLFLSVGSPMMLVLIWFATLELRGAFFKPRALLVASTILLYGTTMFSIVLTIRLPIWVLRAFNQPLFP